MSTIWVRREGSGKSVPRERTGGAIGRWSSEWYLVSARPMALWRGAWSPGAWAFTQYRGGGAFSSRPGIAGEIFKPSRRDTETGNPVVPPQLRWGFYFSVPEKDKNGFCQSGLLPTPPREWVGAAGPRPSRTRLRRWSQWEHLKSRVPGTHGNPIRVPRNRYLDLAPVTYGNPGRGARSKYLYLATRTGHFGL